MNPKLIPLLGMGGLLLWIQYAPQPSPEPDGEPSSIAEVFAGHADDAALVAAHLDGMARVLELDGQRTDGEGEPQFQTDLDVEKYRRAATWYLAKEVGPYPGFGSLAGEYLRGKVGEDVAELTDSQRRRWVLAFRELAQECRKAK